MECPRCLMDDSIEGIVIKKQCNICDMHDRHEKFFKAVKIPKGKAILGISGGLDSSWLAYWAYTNGLDVLLVHFDNGFNADAANKNILKIVAKTGYPFLRFHVDHHYYRICRALLKSGLPDVDIANDLGMAKLVLDVAKQYGIKWIINGHNYRTEGWNPIGWTYMDGRYLRSIVGYVGLAGGLGTKGLKMGDFYLVEKALAMDGTTTHYTGDKLIPSDEILNSRIKELAKDTGFPEIVPVQALTGDAIYREYDEELVFAREHGCDIVNCDSSHLFAVSRDVGIQSTECGVLSDVAQGSGEEWESTLAGMLSADDRAAQDPMALAGKIVEFYAEVLIPELVQN